MTKRIIFALTVLVLATAFAFGGGAADSSNDGSVELSWQIWITPNLTRDFYREVADAFEAERPGVTIELVEVSATGSSGSMDFIRNRLAAGDVPDVWSNFTDIPSFADAGHLWEIPLDDPDLAAVRGLTATAYDGRVYSYASAIQPQSILFYNKALWAEAGLGDADVPRTWAELEAVCERIKQAGLVPIITGGEWVPTVFFDYFAGPQLTKTYPDLWTRVYDGDVQWTDPEIVEILEFMARLVDSGYVMEGSLSIGYAQLEQAFLSGAAVMYPMGSWFTAAEATAEKDWETGCFTVPTKDGALVMTRSGGYGNGMVVYSGSEHPELAFELVKKATLDPVYGAKFIEVDGLFSNLDPPLEYSMSPLQLALAAEIAGLDATYPVLQHPLGSPAPPGVGDYFRAAAEAILSRSYDSLESVLAEIDTFVQETR